MTSFPVKCKHITLSFPYKVKVKGQRSKVGFEPEPLSTHLLALFLQKLTFMSTSGTVPAGENSVTLDHFSRCHWLVVSPSLTEHLSCGTCFPGRCKPPVPCQFSRKKFYHSLTLLSQARTFCRLVLETPPSNYFSSFLSFHFFPFA